MNKPVKQKKCKVCKVCCAKFIPRAAFQTCCSFPCAVIYVKRVEEKKQDQQNRRNKKWFYSNDRKHQLKLTQKVFNEYIRARDRNEFCISCGRKHDGQYHAGHFLTTAAHPELRFNELNAHKQCSPCNNYLSGNIVEYLPRLVAKIGQDKVDFLYNNQSKYKYTLDDLKEIREYYKNKIKLLKEVSP